MSTFHPELLASVDPVVTVQLLTVFVALRGREMLEIFFITYLHAYDLTSFGASLVFISFVLPSVITLKEFFKNYV